MLPKELRLKKKSNIEQTFKSGKTLKSLHFICKLSKNDLGFTRPCATLARNLKLNAAEKNRLRRQILAAFKAISPEINNNQTFDIIIILKKIPGPTLKRYQIFQEELKGFLNQK